MLLLYTEVQTVTKVYAYMLQTSYTERQTVQLLIKSYELAIMKVE